MFKRLPKTRAFQRTSNLDITNRRSEAKLQKTRQRPNLVFQSQLRLSKFLSFGQFLGHFSTSSGSKKFSMGDMMMSKVFKRLPQMRAFQRTSNYDRTTDHSFFIDKSFNPPHPYAGFGPRFFKCFFNYVETKPAQLKYNAKQISYSFAVVNFWTST